MAARIPSRYGKYEIVAPLATGGMADLFLARQRGPSGFEALAVVKRIRQHLAANPEFVRLFLGEARLAAQLRHPNVVSVYDAGQEGGEYFFVMEYVHGRDLRAILDVAAGHGRVITVDEAISIAVGVCAGLHHAHERTDATGQPLGIVHRDISPSNVLVGFEGGVKLADFGIAKATQATKEPGTNSLRGKLSYLSPEQCLGLPLDRRADLYALSVVLYELTTGARPHGEAPSEFLALKQTLEAPVRPPSRLRPGYPEELERIVMRGLIRDRDKRWWSAREMQIELEQFARRRQLAISPVTVVKLMEELFADDLEAWHAAQDRGTDLAEYVAHSRTLSLGDAAAAGAQALGAQPTQLLAPEPEPEPMADAVEDGSRRGKRLVAASIAVALVASMMLVFGARRASVPPVQSLATAPAPAAAVVVPAPLPAAAVVPAPVPVKQPAAKAAVRVRAPARPPKRARASNGWDPEAPVLPH
jgi:hypothetical protein